MADPRGIGVPFSFDPTGFPAPAVGEDLIHDSIYTILSTTVGERVHRPTFGCFLKYLIFESVNSATLIRAQSEVRRAIRTWEPRVVVTEVVITSPETGRLLITVKWIANGALQGTTAVPFTYNTQV